MSKNVFEKYPKVTISFLLLLLGIASLFMIEFLARGFGLGNVVIYDSHPVYGYRLHPNQQVARQANKPIQVNNLGLRAQADWDITETQNKILFVGDSVTYGGSYINNTELFSFLAVRNLPGYQSGNAGVNGWGVLNVHALIKEMHFLPADIYVSVFPEGDFYRGLMRIGGQPFWTRTPRSALEELAHYFLYKVQLTQTPPVLFYTLNEDEKFQIADHAAYYLKQYDSYLKKAGKKHLIYISPSRSELLHNSENDQLVQKALEKHGLQVVYLREKLNTQSAKEINALFHDEIHLSEQGHQQWAQLIEEDLKKLIS